MDSMLTMPAGRADHAAFSRFVAGTGDTEILGATSTLGALALKSPSFQETKQKVQADITAQIAKMVPTGVLDPCALSVTPSQTKFKFGKDSLVLYAVIGGTQGEKLEITGFILNSPKRSYCINLRFIICDNFGVDEADLYASGLFPFWVLQHERSATRYSPFINELNLPVTMCGNF